MKNYLFNDIEKQILEDLKKTNPIRIWSEFTKVVFEFENYYVELDCVPEKAASQNEFDEAITVKVRKQISKFKPIKSATLLAENKQILAIKTVSTLLYFTTFKKIKKPIKKTRTLFTWLKELIPGKDDSLGKILAETDGYYDSIICQPNSTESKKVKPEFSNLIEVGVLIRLGDEFLQAFVKSNGFGFAHLERKALTSIEDLKTDLGNYKLN